VESNTAHEPRTGRFDPEPLDVLTALHLAAADGDAEAAAFLPAFEEWCNAQQPEEDAVFRFLGRRARPNANGHPAGTGCGHSGGVCGNGPLSN
jgi:hypothetical protein